jgi:CHAD domain-containing protein
VASTSASDARNGSPDSRELEWQLTAIDLGAVHRWLTEHHTIQGLSIEHRSPLQVHDTYFDTSDWRIRRAGFALRVRRAAGASEATLKELHPSTDGLADRRELTEPMTEAAPDAIAHSAGPVGARVQAVAGAHALQALFSVDTTRQRFAVRKPDGDDVGEIALDETVISRPDGQPQARAHRVEVEARTNEPQSLEELVKALSGELSLEPATDSKYALGLRSVGLAPAQSVQLGSSPIDGSMRVDEAALGTLRRQLSAWIEHEPGARLGEDPEALHDLRVAARRIDAALALFAEYLPAALARMRKRLEQILKALGGVRDLDVQLASVEEFERQLEPAARPAVEPLRQLLRAERTRARTRMLRILDSPTTENWLARLRSGLLKPSAGRMRHDHDPVTVIAPALLQSRYKKLRKAAKRLTTESSVEDYHRVRGRIKKLRYAVEAVAEIYGDPAAALLRSLRRLQNSLGELQDAHVALTRLHGRACEGRKLSAEAVFLMGRMAESGAAAGARGRDDFHKRYPRLRKRWKQLRRRFDRLPAQAHQVAEATPSSTQQSS